MTTDPNICQHPADKMMIRGSSHQNKSWLCTACQSRWERQALSDITGKFKDEPLRGTDPVTFGTHMGKQYHSLLILNPSYCSWVVKTYNESESSCPALKRFAMYIIEKESMRRDPKMDADTDMS